MYTHTCNTHTCMFIYCSHLNQYANCVSIVYTLCGQGYFIYFIYCISPTTRKVIGCEKIFVEWMTK